MTETSFACLSLSAPLLDNLKTLGFDAMTDIQEKVLPSAMAGHDLIAQAKTGSGKTVAFSLPLLARISVDQPGPQGLILCPTRELAHQVTDEIRRLARRLANIKVVALCGGQSVRQQLATLQHGAHVIVGTPGRLRDHLQRQSLQLNRIASLVIDEADRMLEMGFIDDLRDIIGQTPDDRQTVFFSATYPDDILSLSQEFQTDAIRITATDEERPKQIEQRFYNAHGNDKLVALSRLLYHFQPSSAVIFCNTRKAVNDVCSGMKVRKIPAAALHGDMEQRDRDEVLIRFRQQSISLLVATDVAARGLDIDDLPLVVNYDMPTDADTYTHRIGRTGRAGKEGLAITLVSPGEQALFERLCHAQDRPLPRSSIESLANDGANSLPPPAYDTLCIAAGRKDKLRPGDILGALTGAAGIDGKAVGNITLTDQRTYVAVKRSASRQAVSGLGQGRIKKRRFRVWLLKGHG